jgi:hypothetical protein
MGFVPAMYLQDCEIEEALRLRKKDQYSNYNETN